MLKNLKEFNLPELEKKVLEFWNTNKIFEKSLAKRKGKKRFVFYEGPPTANGKPGIHHLLARVFKDVIPRYKTMRGFYVARQGGWDTHGLPVEIGVEKKLGLKSKKEIEQYGIAEFNKKCKESVWEFLEDWKKLTERIGFWIDTKNAYITYDPKYIQSLWWIIKEIHKKKLFYKGHRVAPWCPRCGTALSSHELAQGYKEDTDDSVFIKFRLKSGQKIGKTSLLNTYVLSWTTTPWTLPGNVALAVNKNIKYVIVSVGKENWILAEEIYKRKPKFLSDKKSAIVSKVSGKDLIGLSYEPLFDIDSLKGKTSYKVYDADFVTTTDGTGVVHTAVMYGVEDYELGVKIGLPQKHTVSDNGTFTKEVIGFGGLYVKAKETEKKIFDYLDKNDNLVAVESYVHDYPHCWRCDTALLYYARSSWFIGMSKLRKELLKENEKINWIPSHFKKGRFGEWLEEVKDWNFSRERYWGTPIPIWICEKCGDEKVLGSIANLESVLGSANNQYILMRHGEAVNNLKHILNSVREKDKFPLTLKGMKQAEASAKKLKAEKIDLIFSSEIRRVRETAEIVADILGIKKINFDNRLVELDGGIFDGGPARDYENYFSRSIDFSKVPPQGEGYRDLRKRSFDFISEMEEKYKGKKILILGHMDPLLILESCMSGLTEPETTALNDERKDEPYKKAEFRKVIYRKIPRNDTGEIDLHRPYIDEVVINCKCGGKMKRTPEVADCWFDSGAMPLASTNYPFENKNLIDKKIIYPADYISEAVDQTRGWFYTLLAVGVAIGFGAPFKNVICLGHINDKFGKKMSKSKGNIIDPWSIIDKYGVDSVRWYFYTATPPGEPKNFDEIELGKTLRKIFFVLYNSYVFYETVQGTTAKKLHILDKWILERLKETQIGVSDSLDKYDVGGAGRFIESLTDDLSKWYIRRSRKRPGMKKTLGVVLMETAKLMAPLTPFFAEGLYKSLKGKALSVHLEDWSKVSGKVDKKLINTMSLTRELSALGLAKRAEAGIKVRQPLSVLKIKNNKIKLTPEIKEILMEEVNVKNISVDLKIKDGVELDTKITPELKEEGLVRDFTRLIQGLRQDAELKPKDTISVFIETDNILTNALKKNSKLLSKAVGAKDISFKKPNKFDVELSTKLEDTPVWLALKKLR